MTTLGPGLNSHNVRYLSQGDMYCPIRKSNQGWLVVTISDICHKVIVTISDTYCISIRPPSSLPLSIRLQHYITAVRPLLRAVPRAGDPQRPAAADVSRMRGMPLLRRRLQAGGAARSQARVPLPQAKGESVEWAAGRPLHHCLLLNPQGYQGRAGFFS